MQMARKRLPAELQYELTDFLFLDEQHKLRPICSSMNNLLRARVGENLSKMKAFCDYLKFRIRGGFPRSVTELFIYDDPYQRIREFRVLERKAAELFGPNGERVQGKDLTEPVYANFLESDYRGLKEQLLIIMDKLSTGEFSQNDGVAITSSVNIPHSREYNFDAVFPKWMNQFYADWQAVSSLCSPLYAQFINERRRWKQEIKHPTFKCDIHPGAPIRRIHHCAANRFHHLCEDCLRSVEKEETNKAYQQCQFCGPDPDLSDLDLADF